ncbi:MAG: exodeoxyribonuclease V subunit alpha [Actinobacteria bacterium]|nr:exodeoxyribonuclease V subunit alpha [Actinomycetota bacterium]
MTGATPVVPITVEGLRPFVDAGHVDTAGVHLAASLARLAPETPHSVLLAAALLLRAVRRGHSCMTLREATRLAPLPEDTDDTAIGAPPVGVDWPDLPTWEAELRASDLVTVLPTNDPTFAPRATMRPIVFEHGRLSLHRYWCHETTVAERLGAAATELAPVADEQTISATLLRLFPDGGAQSDAVGTALRRRLTVLAGGPGTGKTYTVARILAALFELDAALLPQTVAIAAPTGKAAARLTESVRQAVAGLGDAVQPSTVGALASLGGTTIHRLLGSRGGTSVTFDDQHPLPQRVVVVDETSMVDLPLMARLLDALRPDARLVLVGDPDQLASVEVGTVLADIVAVGPDARVDDAPMRSAVRRLERGHRFSADSAIAALADAIRAGDAEQVTRVLAGGGDVRFVDLRDTEARAELHDEVVASARAVLDAARGGSSADRETAQRALRVLSATHHGEVGVDAWRDRVETALRISRRDPWYVGRPVMITRNDSGTGLFNGDTGVTVEVDGRRLVAIDDPSAERFVRTVNLPDVATWWSMTIHKSQGSEFDHAVVCFDAAREELLTRELLYTAVTRARRRLTLVGDPGRVARAVERPVARASGLAARLLVTDPPR